MMMRHDTARVCQATPLVRHPVGRRDPARRGEVRGEEPAGPEPPHARGAGGPAVRRRAATS